MKRSLIITLILSFMMLCIFISVALGQDKAIQQLGWNLKQSMWFDTMKIDEHGTRPLNCIIEFALKNYPTLSLIELKGNKYLEFNTPLKKINLPTKIIFLTPQLKGSWARIPAFKVIEKEWKESYNSFVGKEFKDYPGAYYFEFGLNTAGTSVEYLNCFHDGSEHYIYGEVNLFDVRFVNESKDPLVFKIANGKYVYVKGNGKAITKEGKIIEFGK